MAQLDPRPQYRYTHEMTQEEIGELFAQTLSGDYDDDAPWEAVSALRRIGTREIFVRAAEWCNSENPLLRARGADVLSQLGKTWEHRSNSFPEESYLVVSTLLRREKEPLPLNSAIAALGHIENPQAVPFIVEYRNHSSPKIRFTVACALGNFPNHPEATETLLILMQDADDDVRDWATFGLGVLGDSDSPEIRDSLFCRVSDSNEDVREEAMVGLSKRIDPRVLPFLMVALEQPTMTDRVKEAAHLMLKMGEDRIDWSGNDYVAALRQRFSI
jgi:HEAT repeat protein